MLPMSLSSTVTTALHCIGRGNRLRGGKSDHLLCLNDKT